MAFRDLVELATLPPTVLEGSQVAALLLERLDNAVDAVGRDVEDSGQLTDTTITNGEVTIGVENQHDQRFAELQRQLAL